MENKSKSESDSESESTSELPYLNEVDLNEIHFKIIPSVKQFVAKAIKNNRNIVLITSGGSSVPLERNTVRSLENFSTGKRGAASAEYFLELGYAVIYLFREDTIVPFARHFQQYLSNKIDFEFLNHLRLSPLSLQLDNMDINNDNNNHCNYSKNDHKINLTMNLESHDNIMGEDDHDHDHNHLQNHQYNQDKEKKEGLVYKARLLEWAYCKYKESLHDDVLLPISYVTVTMYLHLLKAISMELQPASTKAMIYLGAAISDFYLPENEMPEHKIQSSAVLRRQLANESKPNANTSEQGNKDQTNSYNDNANIDKDTTDGLTIRLKNVPKCIGLLRSTWCPEAFVISFKLETDKDLLIMKAKNAIKAYDIHAVVANILTTRYKEIFLIVPEFVSEESQYGNSNNINNDNINNDSNNNSDNDEFNLTKVKRGKYNRDKTNFSSHYIGVTSECVAMSDYPQAIELEEIFIEKLCSRHFEYIHNHNCFNLKIATPLLSDKNFLGNKNDNENPSILSKSKRFEKPKPRPNTIQKGATTTTTFFFSCKSKIYNKVDWIKRKIKRVEFTSIVYFLGYSAIMVFTPIVQKLLINKLGLEGKSGQVNLSSPLKNTQS